MLKPTIAEILQLDAGETVEVQAWVKSCRKSKNVGFVHLNDGSNSQGLQVVVENENLETLEELETGAALAVRGVLVTSMGNEQALELKLESLRIIGNCPASSYPLQKKRHSFEFLRSIEHLRGRSNTLSAVMRLRSQLTKIVHDFFLKKGFYHLHTPIIGSSDAEGAGECFEVRTAKDKSDSYFFGKPAYLTVSGQLEAEAYALALGRVYTFGPTFRAENSNTVRHLSEFWMVEPELAFCSFTELQDLAIDFIVQISKEVCQQCQEEIEFFDRWVEKGLARRLQDLASTKYERISYRQALSIFEKNSKRFAVKPGWNAQGLQTEHERFLSEEVFKKPVLVYNYPAAGKAFYMRESDKEENSVEGMDLLLPRLGEIIGGSMREDNYERLFKRMQAHKLDTDSYQWYLDLRRFGSAAHGGFGLGFERLLMYLSGMKNIRDVIPFPRCPA